MRRIKREQRRKQREFIAAVNEARPNINPVELLDGFDATVKNASASMVRLAMRSLAFISAADYAAEALNNQLNATDLTFDTTEITAFARKIIRLNILRRMLSLYRIPREIRKQIVNLQIAKDFGTIRLSNNSPLGSGRMPNVPAISRGNKNGTTPRENPFTRQRPRITYDRDKPKGTD
jgi:hypothetical protein